MAYYDALASSAPSKKKPNKNRPNRLRFVVGGKKFVLFSSFLLDIEFAVLFRERVLVLPGIKKCVCGNPGEVQPRHGVGGNVKNSLLAFVRESRTLEQVGLHGREGEIIELRILLFSTLRICRFLVLFLKKCIFTKLCVLLVCARAHRKISRPCPPRVKPRPRALPPARIFFFRFAERKRISKQTIFCLFCFSMLCFF